MLTSSYSGGPVNGYAATDAKKINLSSPGQDSGNVVSIDGKQSRQQQYVEAITQFAQQFRSERTIKASELQGFDRMKVMWNADPMAAAAYFRAYRKADVTFGLYILIRYMADNDLNGGVCSLSIDRMARFLSRSEKSIIEALKRLEAAGLIQIDPQNGGSHRITPLLPEEAELAIELGAANTWLIDGIAPRGKPIGRPRKDGELAPAKKPLKSTSPLLGEKPPEVRFTAFQKPPEVDGKNPLKSTSDNITREIAREVISSDARVCAIMGIEISDKNSQDWNKIYNRWGMKAAQESLAAPAPHAETDGYLLSSIEAVCAGFEVPPSASILHSAVLNTLAHMVQQHAAQEMSREPSRNSGGPKAASYFSTTLRNKIASGLRASIEDQAMLMSSKAVIQKQHEKRVAGAERGASTHNQSGSSWIRAAERASRNHE